MERTRTRLGSLLPPAGPARRLLAAVAVNSIGDGVYYVCSALFFTRVVGLSAGQLAVGISLGWLVGFVLGIPLGTLADRRGPRGVASALALLTAVAVALYLAVGSAVAFAAVAALYSTAQCGLQAARQALLVGLVPAEQRTVVRAQLQAVVNAGLGAGAAIGGAVLLADSAAAFRIAFVVDAVAFVGAAVILRGLPAVAGVRTAPDVRRARGVLRDRPFMTVALLHTVLLLHIPLIGLVVPLWIVEHTAAPSWTVALLLVLNTLGVVGLQVAIAARIVDLRSASRSVRRAGVVLLVACALFALSAGPGSAPLAVLALAAAAALQTLGEMTEAAGAWHIGFALAPAGRQGEYQAVFGNGLAVARMVGPVLLVPLIVTGGPVGWLVLGVVFAVAAALLPAAVARAGAQTGSAATSR